MERYRVPRVAFINKCDRTGATPPAWFSNLGKNSITMRTLLQLPLGLESSHEGVIDLVTMRAVRFEGEHGDEVKVGEIPPELISQA